MNKLSKAQHELREMDALAGLSSPVHLLHPLAKLIMTIAYIAVVVSFQKYDLTGVLVMMLYPILMYQLAGISVGLCFYRLRIVLPLVCAVGLVNPFLDTAVRANVFGIAVSGGVLSMLTLMLKGIFSLMASFLLIATTKVDALCACLRKAHCPRMVVTLFLLTYRYIGVMLSEVAQMNEAYSLRAPGQKGLHISSWGSFLGQLLLRSIDRAEELYRSMQLRGFTGEFLHAQVPAFSWGSALYCVLTIAFLAGVRCFDIAALLGSLFVR